MAGIYSVSQNYVNIDGLFFFCRQTYTMGDRLTLEQKRVVARLMEVYDLPTAVCQKFAERDPPGHLIILVLT
jgi:hypothetical protein